MDFGKKISFTAPFSALKTNIPSSKTGVNENDGITPIKYPLFESLIKLPNCIPNIGGDEMVAAAGTLDADFEQFGYIDLAKAEMARR